MARNIDDRLKRLADRRKGTDRVGKVASETAAVILAKSLVTESWQRRAETQPHTRYALGAMQAVDSGYTRVGIETAERVGRQLEAGLGAGSIMITFRLQGSVPLDVHIRGVSDVDLLALDTGYRTYAPTGARSRAGLYGPSAGRSSLQVLSELRKQMEKVLTRAYPGAEVDCSGGKCVALSGGSLPRPVDVVPSHWSDTVEYQASGRECDRAVKILDKKVPRTFDNLPFLHIKKVHERDIALLGGLKKAIRLTKHVKNDSQRANAENLASYDIAALLFHADGAAIRAGAVHELAILRETQRFLDWCWSNKDEAKRLRTPDGSRVILDTDDKMSGLLSISVEMDELATAVAREQLKLTGDPSLSQVDEALRKARIPAAA